MIDALFLAAPLDDAVTGAALSDDGNGTANAVRAAYTKAPCAASLSVSARDTLDDLARVIALGRRERVLQSNPHLVVLSLPFYHSSIKPLIAQWMLEWFKSPSQSGLALPLVAVAAKASSVLVFMLNGSRCSAAARRELERGLSQTAWQLLNVANVWLNTFMPHVLSKIDRVSFGLLSYETDIAKQPRMPESRKLSAVPFVGKDKPSPRSEFAHPDVIIGFTIIAFRYEGLRQRDFRTLLAAEKEAYRDERETYDKPEKCPASKRWVEWVHGAGGGVRGAKTRRVGQRRASAAARDAVSLLYTPFHFVRILLTTFDSPPHILFACDQGRGRRTRRR